MPERRPRVLLADDHPMMLEALRKLLERDCEVVETVTDGRALLAAAERLWPDLVITDLSMPGMDGLEATRRLQTAVPGVQVLVLSVHAEPSWVRAAFAAGACGYLTKTSAPGEIEVAVREVLAGRFYVSPRVARAAVLPAAEGEPGLAAGSNLTEERRAAGGGRLTAREHEILRLVAQGLGNQQIARGLAVSVATVRTHLSSVYLKLGVASRVELALYAAHAGRAAG